MFPVQPASLVTSYARPSGRGPTTNLWRKASTQMYSPDGSLGFTVMDDFRSFGKSTAVSSNVGRYVSGGAGVLWYSYEDTGDSIAQIATDKHGVVAVATDGTDNDEAWMQMGDAACVSAIISDTAGDDKLLVFEARVKVSSVTDTKMNMFVGLMEEGRAVADTVTDAGALADKDYIGFTILEGDGDALKFVYKKAGQTAQTVLTYGTAIEADTFYKLGFVFDPDAPADQRIKIYVNGSEQSTYVTATQIAAATFPDGEELSPIFGMKNAAAEAMTASIDWIGLHQAL